jgi:predicted transcriptional regulator
MAEWPAVNSERVSGQAIMNARAEYLRAVEIARLTGMSVRTVRRWIAGETKLRGARLVAITDLERLLSASSRTEEHGKSGEHFGDVAASGKHKSGTRSMYDIDVVPNGTACHSLSTVPTRRKKTNGQ